MFKKNPENINRKGRPKGSKNKEKLVIKDFINELINDNQNLILEDFKSLTPNERIKHTINLMRFVIPFAKDIEIENITTLQPLEFRILPPIWNIVDAEKND